MTARRPVEPIRPDGSTSRSLLVDVRLGEPAAWDRLVRLYAPLVASWCRRWQVAEQDVGDVLQDVFSAVAKHLESFRKERSADTFRGWLRTIARHKVLDHFRRRALEPAAGGGTESLQRMQQIPDAGRCDELRDWTQDPPADDPLLESLLHRALDSIRGEFHARTWQAFWEIVVDGRAAADVGADLAMTPGAVRVAKSRVLHRLRRVLCDETES